MVTEVKASAGQVGQKEVRFKDFDAALDAEHLKEIRFKILGRDYTVPPELPASLVLSQLKSFLEEGGINYSDLPVWLENLVGSDNYKQMLDDGLSWPKLQQLTRWLLSQYGVIGEGDSGNEMKERG